MSKVFNVNFGTTILTAAAAFVCIGLIAPQSVRAEDEKAYELTIKDHVFAPATLEVPAGQKIRLLISNTDVTPEEFESAELKREKVISGNSRGVVFIGPLEPGSYPFHGEFYEKTAKGVIVAK